MTNNLALTQMAEAQRNKYIANNDGNAELDAAITANLTKTITSTNAATVTQAEIQRAAVLFVNPDGVDAPTAAITITIDTAFQRGAFVCVNTTAEVVTVEISGQAVTSPTVAAGESVVLVLEGTNVRFGDSAASGGPFVLLNGAAGGQTIYGGTGSGEDLNLVSTIHATKGTVFVNQGDSGIAPNTSADELAVESAGTGGISILTPAAQVGYLVWGTADDDFSAYAAWSDSANTLTVATHEASGELIFMSATGTEAMRIDASQRLLVGHTATIGGHILESIGNGSPPGGITLASFNVANTQGVAPVVEFYKSGNATKGSHTIVADNEILGRLDFWASDGNSYAQAAKIHAEVDGTPSDGADMPGAIVFSTSAEASATPTERLRIENDGRAIFTSDRANAAQIRLVDSGASGSTFDVASGITGAGSFDIRDITAGGAPIRLSISAAGLFTFGAGSSLVMDRTTDDAPFINYKATADADATSAISTLTTSGATTHHIQIEINGVTAWIAASTTDPS